MKLLTTVLFALCALTTMNPGRQSGKGNRSSLITTGKLHVPSRSTVTWRSWYVAPAYDTSGGRSAKPNVSVTVSPGVQPDCPTT